MKKKEIKVGGHYLAKVSGFIVTVRVDKIEDVPGRPGYHKGFTSYQVVNLRTERQLTFCSASKFRGEVKD